MNVEISNSFVIPINSERETETTFHLKATTADMLVSSQDKIESLGFLLGIMRGDFPAIYQTKDAHEISD